MLTKIFPLTTSLPASTRKHVIPYIIAGIIGLTAAHGSAVSPAQAAEDPAPGTAEQSIRLEEDESTGLPGRALLGHGDNPVTQTTLPWRSNRRKSPAVHLST